MTQIIFMNPHGNSRRSEHTWVLQTLCNHHQNKMKKTLQQHTFMPVKPFTTNL